MFTVAIIGPDGVGKTTVSRRLENSLSVRAKYVYMGVNLESSNLVLPTTRLILEIKRLLGRRPDMAGPPDPSRVTQPRGVLRRTAVGIKRWLRLGSQLMEEWFRQAVIVCYLFRGYVVLLDRDFFVDYYAYDIAGDTRSRPWPSRVHGFVLNRFYRRPDLVICLDAPADLMFERKGEGTVEILERRRQEYGQLRGTVGDFQTVDASRSLDEVAGDVRNRIGDFLRRQEYI